MTEERRDASEAGNAPEENRASGNQAESLEAEQESAAAMDADVPQPPGADETTEGQPS